MRVVECRTRLPVVARRARSRIFGLPPGGAALAREPCERTGSRLGRARARPRLHHRRPGLASAGRASAPRALAAPRPPYVVLGNHDVAITRDPFSRAAELRDLERAHAAAGRVDDRRAPRGSGSPSSASTRRRIARSPPGRTALAIPPRFASSSATSRASSSHARASFDLILAGHLHAGQICLPVPGAASLSRTPARGTSRASTGLSRRNARLPGTGTTFVPLRFSPGQR